MAEAQARHTLIPAGVGRIVWFRPSAADQVEMAIHQPKLAAIICHAFNDRCVNLAVFDTDGNLHKRLSVPLLQDGDPDPAPGTAYAQWMPYQKGQAQRTETLEAALVAAQDAKEQKPAEPAATPEQPQ